MLKVLKVNTRLLLVLVIFISSSLISFAQTDGSDTLAFPFNDNGDQPLNNNDNGGLFLSEPSNIKTNVVYNPETGKYEVIKTIGDELPYQPPSEIGLEEYLDYSMDKSKKDYWRMKSEEQRKGVQIGYRPEIKIESEVIDKIFGGSTVDIKPTGSAELRFGGKVQHTDNPQVPIRNRTVGTFEFDMKIQLNVIGTVGDKMKLSTNYNTESTFEFENQMKLEYTGYEDEIIKKIEAGNVSLPLTGSLITGSQTLFGIKTQLQFGRLMVTSVLSKQNGKKSEITVEGGAQIQEFEVKADQYEQNKHFFLSHYFRDSYEQAVASPPIIKSLVNITRVELWVTNTNNTTENTRNVIAFQDIGESDPDNIYNMFIASPNGPSSQLPKNDVNALYGTLDGGSNPDIRGFTYSSAALGGLNMKAKKDYQKVELARRLNENEYYIHPQLGYISMRQELNLNQMLAVAFQYTYQGVTYQVGEFSDDVQGQDALFLKLLKTTERNTRIPMWDLMMKNVYSIGAYNVQKEGFELEVWYLNRNTGVDNNYLPEGPARTKEKQLLGLLGLDELTVTNLKGKDGVFDYIDNPRMTIVPQNGRIIFPVLEPFGSHIHTLFDDDKIAAKYAFDSLYTNTQTNAKVKFPEKNRYSIRGETKSTSGSEISLGAINIPEGSVVVTSGGVPLVENTDYLVDYNIGRVTIINQSILESGTPIKIALESQQLFNIQPKTLFASRFDYTISDDLILGGTVMNLSEKPITNKVNQGSEPMRNTIIGLDGNYKTESQFLTAMVDKIPLINTKEKSNINVGGEVAKLFPGTSRAIDLGSDGPTAYIDDFEGSQTAIDIKSGSAATWIIASTPQGQPDKFPEGNLVGDLAYGYNRAKLSWYTMDPLFYPTRNDPNMPENVEADVTMTANHFMREIQQKEVFPDKDPIVGSFNNIVTLDMAYYPEERGPYNYDVDGQNSEGEQYGYGLNADGSLKNPEKRWGGIMRELTTNDFEAANVEYIQFWVMDPFAESDNPEYPQEDMSGKLYFNIGQISEDILRDGRKTFEQGMPIDQINSQDLSNAADFSEWGRLPPSGTQAVVNAFVNDPESRPHQDVGLDGLRDEEEVIFFNDNYIQKIAQDPNLGTGSNAYKNASNDPSADNYKFFRDDQYDGDEFNILQRYKEFNGLEGNSPTSAQYSTQNEGGYPTTSSQRPHVEDINNDNTLDETESYYQYSIDISKAGLSTVGRNYLNNILEAKATTSDGERSVKWYQFKIPMAEFEKAVGGISDFRSMRFIRMYMTGFDKPVYLRFAQLQLTRGQWRKYTETIYSGGEELNEESAQDFNIGALNIEENSEKTPVNYILPPGILRELTYGAQAQTRANEQSMTLEVCNLEDGSAYSAYKNIDMDLRRYKRLRMFSHAELLQDGLLEDGDLKLFVRLGTDFDQNYYEYEIPLAVTEPGRYLGTSESDQEKVWPPSNNVDINFEDLWGIKLVRNQAILDGKHANAQIVYDSTLSTGAQIYISGNPNLAEVTTIMIGVRNPNRQLNPEPDDGLPKCATIWVNELRLTEFDDNGGWAAIGRVSANFADLANVSASGSIRTKGFGTVEQKVNERQKETLKTLDVSSTIQLGKFIPEKIGIRLPMYVGFSVIESTPEFSPLAEDVPTSLYENAVTSGLPKADALVAKQELKKITRDITTRKSLNFTNIRKEKAKGSDRKTRFYDISNWTGTYAYTEENHHNFELEQDLIKNYRGGLNYNFNASPKNIKPFNKVKFLRKSKYLRIIKDFNFYPGPKQIGFRTDVNRMYNERVIRNVNPGIKADIDPFYNKNFNWSRSYSFKYDLSKALKLDFTAGANSLIEEDAQHIGEINRNSENAIVQQDYENFKDSVMTSVFKGGENLDYRHNTNINYTIPFSKFPLTNWINSTARYSTSYIWTREAFAAKGFGNTIQNSQSYNLNATFNVVTLYNKVGYLKKVNNKFRKSSRTNSRSSKSSKGKEENDKEKKKKDKNKKNQKTPFDYVARTLMSIRNVNGTYSRNRGTLLPGYNGETSVLGMDDFGAPGYGFLFGQQDGWGNSDTNHYAHWAMMNDWLKKNDSINTQFSRTFTENMNIRASVEPIKDLRIELTANMTNSLNKTEYYRYQGDTGLYAKQWLTESPTEMGSYSSSIITIQTAFIDGFGSNNSAIFDQFLQNRVIISQRLDDADGISSNDDLPHASDSLGHGYRQGYGATSKEVLVPAFLAAYTGTSPENVSLDPAAVGFKNSKYLPIPNWSIRYNGLSKIKFLKKYVRKISLNHTYKSSYSLSGYSTNLDYDRDRDRMDVEQMLDQSANYESKLVLNTITISEKFSPLINVDMTFQNSFQGKFEIRKDRTLSLNIANTQITETKGMEYVLGMGYIIDKVKLPFQLREGTDVVSPLKLRADLSYRRNETIIRKVIEESQQTTSGQDIISIKVTGDYNLSKALRLRAFADYGMNIPKTSTTFKRWDLNFGVSILFTLAG